MGLPQDFLEIVYQNEDTAVSIGCVCLANIMRLLRLKHSAIILHSAILGRAGLVLHAAPSSSHPLLLWEAVLTAVSITSSITGRVKVFLSWLSTLAVLIGNALPDFSWKWQIHQKQKANSSAYNSCQHCHWRDKPKLCQANTAGLEKNILIYNASKNWHGTGCCFSSKALNILEGCAPHNEDRDLACGCQGLLWTSGCSVKLWEAVPLGRGWRWNVLISRLHPPLFCPQILINVSSWDAVPNLTIDLIYREGCLSSGSIIAGLRSSCCVHGKLCDFPMYFSAPRGESFFLSSLLCHLFFLWPKGPQR